MNKRLTPLGMTARILGVPASWLRFEAEAGRIPHLRAGTRLLFDVETVECVLVNLASESTNGDSCNG